MRQVPKRGQCGISGFATMRDVKECARICSSPWFDPGTMRFFASRVGQNAYASAKANRIAKKIADKASRSRKK